MAEKNDRKEKRKQNDIEIQATPISVFILVLRGGQVILLSINLILYANCGIFRYNYKKMCIIYFATVLHQQFNYVEIRTIEMINWFSQL